MDIDSSAAVFQLLDSVVNVDTVIFVGQVSLQLVPAVPVYSKLLVDRLQGSRHLHLASCDAVNLPH